MSKKVIIDDDLVEVKYQDSRGEDAALVLAWGDPIEIIAEERSKTRVGLEVAGKPVEGTVRGKIKTRPSGVLQFSLVDVQQGDGMVLQSPQGKVMLIDGGDNQLFARYLAARFRDTTAAKPLELEAILVTHGDADHFAGLSDIVESEVLENRRLFLYPKRIFHNGLVKGPSNLAVEEIFGQTIDTPSGPAIIDLVDDIRDLDQGKMNSPFKKWRQSIEHWGPRGAINMQRLKFGEEGAFDFLNAEGIQVKVLGPIPLKVRHEGKDLEALPLLRQPPRGIESGEGGSWSASHTINGHSVVLHLTFGNVRFLFGGDLNREAMQTLREKVPSGGLEAEIFKVPHHGSADFDEGAVRAIAPVVSLISSGDESSRKEYIHPRANLLGALGKFSRGESSLVLCTELSAFFAYRGPSVSQDTNQKYIGFERLAFGIVHVRTDGERVLVFTHSGKRDLKEAYRFRVAEDHGIRFEDIQKR